MASAVRLFRVTPGAHTLRELLTPLLNTQGEVRITAFSSSSIALCRQLFDARANVEICEFGQVVGAVLAERQGVAPLLPAKGLIVAALQHACADLDEDSPFHRVRAYPGFHQLLARAWETTRSYQIELPVPSLAGKTGALAAIFSRTEQLLQMLGRRFNADAMAACPELEPEAPPFNRLIVVAGSEYRPAEFDWLDWLSTTGVDVNIVAERHAAGSKIFAESDRIEARFGEARIFVNAANPLAESVFAESDTTAIFDCEILEAPDVLSECEWVLRRAVDRAEGNPSRVAIFCRNLESYGPILQAVAARFEVPLSVSRRFPLLATSMARTALDVLNACASNDVRNLMRLARSPYFPLPSLAARTEFEEACRLAYREHSAAWSEIGRWSEKETSPEWLRSVLAWREVAVAGRTTLEGWRERLIELATTLGLAHDEEEDSRDQRAVTAMLRSLAHDASVDRITTRRELSVAEFSRACRRLWEREEVSIEPDEGGIQVVSAADQIGPVDTLFVMGMLEGEFPRRRTEDPLFTDDELLLLSPEILIPNSVAKAAAERDEFYRACCAPASALVLSYPRVDEDRDNVPAFYLEEIRRATGLVGVTQFSRSMLVPNEASLAADQKLQEALAQSNGWPPPPELVALPAVAIARGAEAIYSPKELADALECPFRYFAKYRLAVKPSHERMRWASLSDLPRQARLADQPDPETATSVLRDKLDEHLGSLMADVLPHDYRLMRSGASRLIDSWVNREFRARAIWPRDNVRWDNVGFEHGPLRAKLKLPDGRFVQLKGSVPAVSVRGDLEVIHLYKGRDPIVDQSAEGESKIAPHEQMELELYLLMRDARDRPAGVEIDHGGGRRLVTVGTAQFPRQDIKDEMRSTAFEAFERPDLLTAMVQKVQIAVDHIQSGSITPTPEESRCFYCEFGELCRRSHQFSEVDDPFEMPEEDEVFTN